jgi:hypothetical protein
LNLRTIVGCALACWLSIFVSSLQGAPNSGKISGVVLDPSGTVQMGATVLISSEQVFSSAQFEFLTNDRGRFFTSSIPAGPYSIKVTLAGFLPAIEQHIEVSDQRTTLLEVMLGSVFSSFGKLRQQPNQKVAKDDWAWVLRTSAATRSVLQYQDAQVTVLGEAGGETGRPAETSRGLLALSSGGDRPGSVGALPDSPGTVFVYDLGVGDSAKFLMAGQFSTERGASAESFAGEWLPSGKPGVGSVTTLVVRQSQLGPSGPMFRGLRLSHDDQLALSDRVAIRYGGEILVASLMNRAATVVRPRAEVDLKLGRGWRASTIVATRPWGNGDSGTRAGIDSALNALDVFPTVLVQHSHPVTEDDLHAEVAIEHALGRRASLSAALFHDTSNHTAIIGQGGAADGPDFLQDYFSQAFAYDGGKSSSLGTRVAYTQKLSGSTETSFVYAYGDVLSPLSRSGADESLREQLSSEGRHSLAARTSTTIPRLGTKVTTGYKWLSGPAVSRQDAYGESFYHIDPYLSLQIKQPVPGFFSGHMEVEADAGNLLAQGYVPVSTNRGRVVLVPSYRYFRGGLSFQF